ncbi:MAG: hypothetical protein V1817_03750 [Candidatus Micrarchaeota archaeon]
MKKPLEKKKPEDLANLKYGLLTRLKRMNGEIRLIRLKSRFDSGKSGKPEKFFLAAALIALTLSFLAPLAAANQAVRVPVPTVVPSTRYECSIAPGYAQTAITAATDFSVRCTRIAEDAVALVPCPDEIEWTSDAGVLLASAATQNRAALFAGTRPLNGGFVRADMVFGEPADVVGTPASCQATVDVYTKAKSCVLLPASAVLDFGEQKRFETLCYSLDAASLPLFTSALTAPTVACPDFVWSSDAGAVSDGSNKGATLTAASAGAGKFLEARYTPPASIPISDFKSQFYCRTEITVNAAPAPSVTPTPTPTPTPQGGGNGGGGGGGSNILLPYTGYNYINHAASPTPSPSAPPAAPSASPNPRPQMGKLVIYPVTAKPSASPSPSPAAAAAGGLTGLFTAQSAPLALGLLLGIIAVALLWYWLAGGKNAKGGEEGVKGGKGKKAKKAEAKSGKASKKKN